MKSGFWRFWWVPSGFEWLGIGFEFFLKRLPISSCSFFGDLYSPLFQRFFWSLEYRRGDTFHSLFKIC